MGWWEKKLELLRACVVEASAASLVMLVTKLGTCERRRDNGEAGDILAYVLVGDGGNVGRHESKVTSQRLTTLTRLAHLETRVT